MTNNILAKLARTTACAGFITIIAVSAVHADEMHHQHSTPDSHAPLGVPANHMHKQGEIMLNYSYKNMSMLGLLDGDSDVTPAEVVAAAGAYGYMMTPTSMQMDMHMVGAMYGLTDDVTLMAMGQYMEKDMEMVNRAGVTSKMDSQGWGDTAISALVRLYEEDAKHAHATFGLSLPTGETDFKGVRMGAYGNLPYGMQLGSGTYDPILGLTYVGREQGFSYGAQANAKFRMGTNDEGYSLGNEYVATSWVARNVTDWASLSARVEGKHVGKIDGADANTIGLSAMTLGADPANHGGDSVNLGLGVNLLATEGALEGHRLEFEYVTPIYQNLNGPQMETQHTFLVSWKNSFN